jgi:hypothetical protein
LDESVKVTLVQDYQGKTMTVEKKSSAAAILLAWAFVAVPAGWGVYNTVHNSMKLFQKPVVAAQPSPGAPTK